MLHLDAVFAERRAVEPSLPASCDGLPFAWVTGAWRGCVAATREAEAAATQVPAEGIARFWSREPRRLGAWDSSLELVQNQAFLMLLWYNVVLSLPFQDLYEPLRLRTPVHFVWCATCAIQGLTAVLILSVTGKVRDTFAVVPDGSLAAFAFVVWPGISTCTSEYLKKRDRESWQKLQTWLEVLFGTRLGMWSPK